jgi:dihydrofolate synthase / folylpolyglutamate synthase
MNESDDLLGRFLSLHPRQIDLSLERMQRLLADLGHPEKQLPPVIHVAGTNGKGSTIAFLRAMLKAAGLSVHVYTSPHLVRFNERIRLGRKGLPGEFAGDATLIDALDEIERVNAGQPITLFEVTTALGLSLFARHPADILLLEVGLGGRYDATNVVDAPLASVITPVSIDHTGFLGDKLEGIAGEKAGIIKRRVPVISAPQEDIARNVIEREAARHLAPFVLGDQDWQAREERGRLVYEDAEGLLDMPLPRLRGQHQQINAGTAIATLRALPSLSVSAEAIEGGLSTVVWPARLQQLTSGVLLEQLPLGADLWLDGSHNEAGAQALARALGEMEERSPRPVVLVVGMLNTKDSERFMDAFQGLVTYVHAVPIPGNPNSRPPEEIARAARAAGMPASSHGTLGEALQAVNASCGGVAPRVLIAGSLYLAGHVLSENGTPPV